MHYDISIVSCADYCSQTVNEALIEALNTIGGLDWVKPGMNIAIKANLVTFMKPESAAVTHYSPVAELCRILTGLGASVVIGDSPGGPWNPAYLGRVYAVSGMKEAEKAGAVLNKNMSQREVQCPDAVAAKSFPFTSWLDEADAVIDFCKLKTHGLTAISCAVKNMFGVVPGTRKPEFHYLFPRIRDFSNMLVDICEYVKPRLTIVDAVEAMEGNGPTQGRPVHMGALIAANSPYDADLFCAHLIGLDAKDAPTIEVSIERGLCPRAWEKLNVYGNPDSFILPDFERQPGRDIIRFEKQPVFIRFLLERCFGSGPKIIDEKCTGCKKCLEMCPVKTIIVKDGKARIKRADCIRCFCCQEFCPNGAVIVHRPLPARLLSRL